MYNLDEIKAISCVQVAKDYGIELEERYNRLWGKLRAERTPSFSIVPSKNLWYDFGSGEGGSVIDLVAKLENIEPKEAIKKIAENYGIDKEKTNKWRGLTDSQYLKLGLYPEKATLNFGFDLNKHTPRQLHYWNEKYGMPLKELAKKYPRAYNKLLEKRAKEVIKIAREFYNYKVEQALSPNTNIEDKIFYKKWAEMDAKEINEKVKLLNHAYYGNKTFNELMVDPAVDLEKVIDKEQLKKNLNNTNTKELSEDEKLRKRIIKIYKETFNFPPAQFFTVEQAKALHEVNTIVGNSNSFLPIDAIQEGYKMLGKNLEKFSNKYNLVIEEGKTLAKDKESNEYKRWIKKEQKLKKDLNEIKDLFKKCENAVEAIKQVSIVYNNNKSLNKTVKSMELVQ